MTVRGIGRGQLMFTADAGMSNALPTVHFGKSTTQHRSGRLADRVELINIGAQIRAPHQTNAINLHGFKLARSEQLLHL